MEAYKIFHTIWIGRKKCYIDIIIFLLIILMLRVKCKDKLFFLHFLIGLWLNNIYKIFVVFYWNTVIKFVFFHDHTFREYELTDLFVYLIIGDLILILKLILNLWLGVVVRVWVRFQCLWWLKWRILGIPFLYIFDIATYYIKIFE